MNEPKKISNKAAILCVDDEKTVLQSLKAQLKFHYHNRYRYEMAFNAAAALEIIDSLVVEGVKVILIVSDWLMPGMKGDEFLTIVHRKYPKIVTVLLTAHANEDAIENARKNANLLACIYKPWSVSEIINVVDKAELINE